MYKNQLQEFAQRSCINLPSYSCIREGPDHAPQFKAKVNFDGDVFESPKFCSTLRQAEHAAAEVALITLSQRGPSSALATRVQDETGIYKNLLQETAHRAGMKLPSYTTVRSGPGYAPVFICTVELARMSFSGEPTKTKKQAQKSAAMVAWFALKELSQECSTSSSYDLSDLGRKDEQEQVIVARYLSRIKLPDTRKTQQREKGKSRKEIFPAKGNVIPYSCSWSPYRMPHQNSAYTYFSPEFAMYQTWPQCVTVQKNHLLALSSTSTSIPRPRFFPLVRSIFRPEISTEMSTFFCSRDQELLSLAPGTSSPFFYLPNNFLPVPDRSGSHVTIEEIEDNNQVEDFSWLPPGFICNKEITTEARETTLQPENLNSVSVSSDAPRLAPPPTRIRGSVFIPPVSYSRGRNPTRLLPEVSNSFVPASTPRRPLPAVFTYPTRPRLEDTRQWRRMPCASQMAPSVQIRSVVPVCSSPVTRMPSPVQEHDSSRKDETKPQETVVDISTANSEFRRLQI